MAEDRKIIDILKTKGYNLSVSKDILKKHLLHYHTILSLTFMELYLLLNKLWIRTKISSTFRKSKGSNSSVTLDILTKLPVHYHTMVVYTQNKCNEV